MVDVPSEEPVINCTVQAGTSCHLQSDDTVYDFVENDMTPVVPLWPTNSLLSSGSSRSANSIEPQTLSGRRIVTIAEFLSQIQRDRHEGGFGCSWMDSEFVREVRFGFSSKLVYQCRMCNKETTLLTDTPSTSSDVNTAVVSGVLGGGGSYASLKVLGGATDLPCMSAGTYFRYEAKIGEVLEDAARESMLQAGAEERAIAFAEENVDIAGNPRCTVVADGMWGKRSYKNKYDALSGMASIVGLRTQKVLFYSVRNKHCYTCERAKNEKKKAPVHKCFKNWTGPSTAMEADIISEGFTRSMEMHGIQYHELIGDGDSSAFNRLLEIMPYGPHLPIKKIECKNHLLRNYRSALLKIASTTQSVEKHLRRDSIRMRKCLGENVVRLSVGISKACAHHNKQKGPFRQRVAFLKDDIKNAPAHVFGCHSKCASYYCKRRQSDLAACQEIHRATPTPARRTTRSAKAAISARNASVQSSIRGSIQAPPQASGPEESHVETLMKVGLWSDIMRVTGILSEKADSLIHNATNNICEVTNSVAAKFLSGKRVCYSKRGSFNARCAAAILSMNSSGDILSALQKRLGNAADSPGSYSSKFIEQVSRKQSQRRKRRAMHRTTSAKRYKRAPGADANYGNAVEPLPLTPLEELASAVAQFVEELRSADRAAILGHEQGSQDWATERKKRLTASNFGAVCRMRPSTSCKKMVHAIIYERIKTVAMRHGNDTEDDARLKLEAVLGGKITKCGLFVDKDYPFLAASPDGLFDDAKIVEIKCPLSAEPYESAKTALEDGKITYLEERNGRYTLKRSSHYFYQVQGQLHIAQKLSCEFFVYTSKWHVHETILRDDSFWEQGMVKQLERFYFEALLPELIERRYAKRRLVEDIREAPYVIESNKARTN